MPVLLQASDEQSWIDIDMVQEEIDRLLVSYDETKMEAHPVSRLIKSRNVSRNIPEVIKSKKYTELPSLS